MGSFCEYRSTDDVKQKKQRQKTKQLQTRPNHKRSETIQIQCSPVLAEGPKRSGSKRTRHSVLSFRRTFFNGYIERKNVTSRYLRCTSNVRKQLMSAKNIAQKTSLQKCRLPKSTQ